MSFTFERLYKCKCDDELWKIPNVPRSIYFRQTHRPPPSGTQSGGCTWHGAAEGGVATRLARGWTPLLGGGGRAGWLPGVWLRCQMQDLGQ